MGWGFARESFCPSHEIVHSSNQVSCGNGHAFHSISIPLGHLWKAGDMLGLGLDLLQLLVSQPGDWQSPGTHTLVPVPPTQRVICPEPQTSDSSADQFFPGFF